MKSKTVVLISYGKDGGFAQYPALLANGLSNANQVHFFSPIVPEALSRSKANIKYHHISDPDSVTELFKTEFEMRHRIASIKPDIIHYPFFTGSRCVLSSLLLKSLSIPLVGTIHDPKSHSGEKISLGGFEFSNIWGGRDIKAEIRRSASSVLDTVFVHGEDTKRQAQSIGYCEQSICKIEHGLYSHFQNKPVEDAQNGSKSVLVFGNIRRNKGYDRITKILSIINERMEGVSVTVAGRTTEDSSWAETLLKEYHNHEQISLKNEYIPTKDVQDYFEAASIVLLPYYDATSSGVAMTAYTFNRPLVVTDTGDLGRLVRDDGSGLVAEQNSAEALAECVVRLLSDDRLYSDCVSNIRSNKSEYSWDCIADSTIEVYSSILQEKI